MNVVFFPSFHTYSLAHIQNFNFKSVPNVYIIWSKAPPLFWWFEDSKIFIKGSKMAAQVQERKLYVVEGKIPGF